MSDFRDYDEAVAEVDGNWFEFKFGGKDFRANMNVDGALVLRWMSDANSIRSIPPLLIGVLGEDQYKELLATGQPWHKYEALITDIFAKLGGRGNESTSL